MSLIHREPAATWPQESLWGQDLVDGLFRDLVRNVTGDHLLDRMMGNGAHLMRVEEFIEDGSCVIRAELPGIDPERDVEITLAEGVMTMRAERRERTEEERPDGFHSEFHYGALVRRIRLPEGTTEQDVKATYRDGILEVRVPAPQPAAPTPAATIPVSRS
ncbi:MAG TPA: Hsp20/alpha crystallin family protein [Nocardioides sp.]|uniref:Hsp20/alpha crystallin family protein n=1 Tax=Nocardioides sp. TaxID=35761 RepID=UPI002BFBFF9B|nr:Hsp20/alpha crystallin family protein [Nocardioides sp.]HTW13874.1 Hsp20/alpha crystallin family protein [Nocardioides sp.]